jgi:hypothetical protein
MAHTVFVRGIPEDPTITSVRERDQPSTSSNSRFRIPINATAMAVAIQLDSNGDGFKGQVYRWFRLAFADGRGGWVRDDLLDIQGDLRDFGYSIYGLTLHLQPDHH